jgi:hypothetical protein
VLVSLTNPILKQVPLAAEESEDLGDRSKLQIVGNEKKHSIDTAPQSVDDTRRANGATKLEGPRSLPTILKG